MELSIQGSNAFRFYQVLKSRHSNIKITKNKTMTKTHLDINIRWFNKISETFSGGYITIETAIYNKITDTLKDQTFIFHASNIKIGKPMKCSMCNGTGKSMFPNDRFNRDLSKRHKQ